MARRRRTAAIVLSLAALLTATVPAAVASGPTDTTVRTIDGRIGDWQGTSSQLGGTTQLSRGELVYQDHLYDDLGADTGQRAEQYGTVQNPKGDVRYPTDDARYGRNAADLLELRLAVEGDRLAVLARLNTLKATDSTVVALGFDTAPASPAVEWPHGAGLTVAGVDHVVTLWGTGGAVTDLDSGTSSPVETAVDTDNAHNAIEARLPLAALGVAPHDTVRVWAVTGLWAGDHWLPIASRQSATEPGGASPAGPTLPVFNVAFRDGETGSFFEEHQAAALAAGDISPFHVDVDLERLASGADDPYEVEGPRFHAVILDTGITIGPDGEGAAYTGIPGRFPGLGGAALAQEFNFFGRHQPYGLYIPSTHDPRVRQPAALVLHGLGGSHASYNKAPGFLADMGEGADTGLPSMYLVTPLARGSSFYADEGEAETLRVLEDALRRVPVDEERLYLTGYSMGGYGVYRLASLYPDRFAAAAVWAGYTGEFTGGYLTEDLPRGDLGLSPTAGRQGQANIGNPVLTMENLRHLPLLLSSGSNDEIVPTSGQYASIDRLRELGYRNRWDLYPGFEHFSFGLLDEWSTARRWLGDHERRETAPQRITYRFSDGWTAPGLATKLGLVHGNAWWLRDLAMRDPVDDAFVFAEVDARSLGIPGADPSVADPPPSFEPLPAPHTVHEMSWEAPSGKPPATQQRLELELTRLDRGTIDLARAGLGLCGLDLAVTTDGPTALRLVSPVTRAVFVSGAADVTIDRQRVLRLPAAGTYALRLACAGTPSR